MASRWENLREEARPLYARVAARLMDDLVAGGAAPGDRLPSERRLTEHYAVSRTTLRGALKDLEQRRLIEPSAARGWFVSGQPDPGPAPRPVLRGFADLAVEQGLVTHTSVLGAGVRPCTIEEGRTFRMAPGADLFELRRVRYLDGLVVAVEHNRLPLALCPELASTDFSTASLWTTLRTADPVQVPTTADYDVEARSPTAEECTRLEIGAAVPLLVATQLTANQHDQPLELTVAAYRSDRYRFTASLGRR